MNQAPAPHELLEDQGETVEIEEGLTDVEETPDGGAILRLEQDEQVARSQKHFANIVDDVDQKALGEIVIELLDLIPKDREAREKRDKLYEEGLRRTGLGNDAPGGASFSGANKVVHPMLVEACVDFSARVMKEIMPPSGPVKSKVLGDRTRDKLEKAERKTEFMNWQTTELIRELRGELEQLTTQQPLGGSQYLKVTWDRRMHRPTAEFVPIDDMLLPFAATNFYTADRRTHVQYVTRSKFEEGIREGVYREVDITSPDNEPDFSKAEKANQKIEGKTSSGYNEDGLRTLYEVSLRMCDIEGEYAPYILTIDLTSRKAVSLYRNWLEEDPAMEELDWVVEFPFVPWRGAYAIGLTHMIGSLSGATTGALRALLDSAHIQNMPTAIKLKGGPTSQTINLQPTQIQDIDAGASDDIRKVIMPLPFNPPSQTLFQLLGFLVDAGRGVVQTTFEKLADGNVNQPVGTTLALIEQGMVVYSSIHSRIHSAMARLLNILHRLNRDNLTEDLLEKYDCGIEVKPEDFDGPMDVVPVSDPTTFSETQRFAQVQAIMQRSAVMPQMYDARKVEEMFLRAMHVPDDILVPKPGEDDVDPVSENVAASMGRPVYVLPKQDHVAHLAVHMQFIMHPAFGGNPLIAPKLFPIIVPHLVDHLLNYYLVESHKAAQEGHSQKILGEEDTAQEVALIAQVQDFIAQQLGPVIQQMPMLAQQAQKYAPPPPPQDPTMAVAQLNANVQQQALQQRTQSDQAKLQDKEMDRQSKLQLENLKEDREDRRDQADLAARMQMNSDDNRTALTITDQRIAAGMGSTLSTGTGINPNP